MSEGRGNILCIKTDEKEFTLYNEATMPQGVYSEPIFSRYFTGTAEMFLSLAQELPKNFSTRAEVEAWFRDKTASGYSFT